MDQGAADAFDFDCEDEAFEAEMKRALLELGKKKQTPQPHGNMTDEASTSCGIDMGGMTEPTGTMGNSTAYEESTKSQCMADGSAGSSSDNVGTGGMMDEGTDGNGDVAGTSTTQPECNSSKTATTEAKRGNEDDTIGEILASINGILKCALNSTRLIQEYVYDLQEAASKVKDGEEKLALLNSFGNNQLVVKHYDEAPGNVIKCKEMMQLVAELRVNKIKSKNPGGPAGGASYATVASEGQQQRRGKRSMVAPEPMKLVVGNPTGAAKYELVVRPKDENMSNLVKLVYTAIAKSPVHIDKVTKQGCGAVFTIRSRNELIQVEHILATYVMDGKKFSDLHTVKREVTSKHVIKTGKFPSTAGEVLNDFVKTDGSLDQEAFSEMLAMRNSSIFASPAEVEHVELVKLPQAMMLLKIVTGKAQMQRAIAEKKMRHPIDVMAAQVYPWEEVAKDACHLCHKIGHFKAKCPMKTAESTTGVQCPYCPAKHPANTCKLRTKERAPDRVCFKCRDYNINLEEGEVKRRVDHKVNSSQCMTARVERDLRHAAMQKRNKDSNHAQ